MDLLLTFLDPQIRVRLLAIHLSGHMDVVSFTQVLDTAAWSVFGDVINTEAISNPLQHGNFVLDEKTGLMVAADRGRIFLSQNASNNETRSILVTTGTKGARTYAEINGQRIAKVDWGSGKMGNIQRTQIVEKMGMCSGYRNEAC
jgi:syntaxin-binding protein 5